MKKFWQGNDAEELLMALVAMIFVAAVTLYMLHISLTSTP